MELPQKHISHLYENHPEHYQKYMNLMQRAETYRHMNWNDKNTIISLVKEIEVADYLKKEGYWAMSPEQANDPYPWPIENQMSEEDVQSFLTNLGSVEAKIQRKKLKNASFRAFLGYSKCRCCGKLNGTQEYSYGGWVWPVGYRHYIEEHKVRPTISFILFIRSLCGDIK